MALAEVRLQMFHLEAAEQKRQLVSVIACIVVSGCSFLLGFIALLFCLNILLDGAVRIWVFISISVFFLGVLAVAVARLLFILKNSCAPFDDTLRELKKDLSVLQGHLSIPDED